MRTLLAVLAVGFSSSSLIHLLIGLLILALVIYCVFLVLGMLPLPDPAKKIITVILAIVFLLILLSYLGISF